MTCKKRGFDSLELAQQAAHALVRAKAKTDPIATFLRAYGCHCGKFHFGKTKDINWSVVTGVKK